MRTREMPDWMMDYVAAIDNNECYQEFRNLSSRYYNEISYYHQNIYPQQNMNNWSGNKAFGKENKNLDPAPHLHSIDEKYKKESLDVACKYGYEKPSKIKTMTDADITKQQQSSEFQKVIKEEDKLPLNASIQDEIAKEAHKEYFEKHPDAKENFRQNKEKCRADEKFDIELEKEGDFASRFKDRLRSSKKEKENKDNVEPKREKDFDKDDI